MSEQKQFDVPEVVAALKAAVEKRDEGYTYSRSVYSANLELPFCLYTHRTETGDLAPGCIVGQVYYDLTGQLIPHDPDSQGGTVRENYFTLRAFTDKAQEVLSEAQGMQDDGAPWGEVVQAAIARAEEL